MSSTAVLTASAQPHGDAKGEGFGSKADRGNGRLKSNAKESSENEAAELQDKLLQQKAENVEIQSSMASKDNEIAQLQASHGIQGTTR